MPPNLRRRLEPDGRTRRRGRTLPQVRREVPPALHGRDSQNSYGDGATEALEEGWKRGVGHARADGIITKDEESRLREFRDRLSLADSGADRQATAQLDKASRDRLTLDARLGAVAVENPEPHLADLAQSLRDSKVPQGQQTAILIRAWEAVVEGALEDGLITLDEENALNRYMDHFNLTQAQMDQNGVLTQVVKAAVIRDIAEDIVPDQQNIAGRGPFNLMKSEKLVWLMQEVDYLEVVTRRERRGSSHGLSIRVAKGVYYRPGTFRSRSVEWEETSTKTQDSGLHHQAHPLLRSEEEIQGAVRPHRGLRALR